MAKAKVEATTGPVMTPGGRAVGVTGAPGFAAAPAFPEKIGLPRGVGSSHPNTEIVNVNDPNEVAQPPYASYAEGIAAARAARNDPPQSKEDLVAMNTRRTMSQKPEEAKKLSRTAQPTVSGQDLRRASPNPNASATAVAATSKPKTRGKKK